MTAANLRILPNIGTLIGFSSRTSLQHVRYFLDNLVSDDSDDR